MNRLPKEIINLLFVRPKLYWLFLAIITFCICVPTLLPYESATRISFSGLLLQLFGLFTIATGIKQLRNLFKIPSDNTLLFNWLNHLKKSFQRKEPVTVSGHAQASDATVTGHVATLTTEKKPTPTLEQRIYDLEKELKSMQEQIENTERKLNIETKNRISAIKIEQNARNKSIAGIEKFIEEVSVGGIYLESVGLGWLTIGIFLSTIPSWIAKHIAFLG